jgi:hypothetical protein
MKQRWLPLVLFLCLVTVSLVYPSVAHAQVTSAWDAQGSVCVAKGTDVATIQGLQCLVANILGIGVSAIGFVGFIMMIYGAFRYLLSGGNSRHIDEGKNSITYAIAGLVLALSAFFIINLISAITGVKGILSFTIPAPSDTKVDKISPF